MFTAYVFLFCNHVNPCYSNRILTFSCDSAATSFITEIAFRKWSCNIWMMNSHINSKQLYWALNDNVHEIKVSSRSQSLLHSPTLWSLLHSPTLWSLLHSPTWKIINHTLPLIAACFGFFEFFVNTYSSEWTFIVRRYCLQGYTIIFFFPFARWCHCRNALLKGPHLDLLVLRFKHH